MSYVLHGYTGSGNCFKVELLLTLLGHQFEWHEVDLKKRQSRSAEFLALNPNGKVPTLVLPSGEAIAESNAILCHLAEGTKFLPAPGLDRTRVLEWMFFEQCSHEPYVAVLRASRHLKLYALDPARAADLEMWAKRALAVMEQHLSNHPYFGGDTFCVADIALFAYTDVAEEGELSLAPYPHIREWLKRVKSEPGFIPMPLQR